MFNQKDRLDLIMLIKTNKYDNNKKLELLKDKYGSILNVEDKLKWIVVNSAITTKKIITYFQEHRNIVCVDMLIDLIKKAPMIDFGHEIFRLYRDMRLEQEGVR